MPSRFPFSRHFLSPLALCALAWLPACSKRQPVESRKEAPMKLQVHEDTAALSRKLRLPSSASVRWIEIPRSDPRGLGPTDTRLFVLAKIEEKDWPAWEQALGAPIQRSGFHLPPAIADSLLPADLIALCPLDSNGRNVPSGYFKPSALATSLYSGVAAARLRDRIVMEFLSQ
jgi:hypothetical protein